MGLSSQLAASSLARPGVCTSSTRPASPYEGQVIYETDTDKTLVWNGSAWVFLSTSTANPVGLELIASTTVGSGVSTLTLPAGIFSSTYDAYRVILSNISTNSSSNQDLYMQMNSGGTAATGANYSRGAVYVIYATSTVASFGVNNATSHIVSSTTNTSYKHYGVIELFNPYDAVFTGIWSTGYLGRNDIAVPAVSGVHLSATSYDRLTFLTSAGTITGGTISVYGYKK